MADYGFNLNLGPQTKPTSIADMLNIAGSAQALQQAQQINPLQVQEARQRIGQAQQMNPLLVKQQEQVVGKSGIELEQATRTNDEQKALQLFLSNPENWQTDGRIDTFKLNKAVPAIAPLTGNKFIQELTSLGETQTKNTEALQGLSKSQRSIIAGPMGVLGRRGEQDPKVYIEELQHIKETHPNQKELHKLIDIQIDQLNKTKPNPNVAKSAVAASQFLLNPEQQEAQFAPKAGLTDVGGQLVETINRPATGGNLPSVSVTGVGINKTLPPGTQVVAGENDPYGYPAGTKYYLPTSQPQSATKPAVTALDPAAAAKLEAEGGAVKSAAEVSTQDWSQTYKESKDANNTIASLQTIKKLVPDTFTGVGGERKKVIAGLAQAVGIPAYELETTSTDELMKNTKILQLAGGNTDAARQISELANPNVKMTKDAILNVVNQLVGMNRMKIARADYLAPYANNPDEYSKKSQLFNKFADYRLFQELTPAEVKKMKQSMSPAERDEIKNKIQQARMAGIIK
jgi:hypothetical protein